jgi:hypothetical protein
MSREVWYEIVDRHGVAFPAGRDQSVAIAKATRWDDGVPEEAPHRVFRVTRERVYP